MRYEESVGLVNVTGGAIGALERILAGCPGLGLRYGRRFYSDLVGGELKHADLPSGSSVLHVGCGALPLTALRLARRGFSVTALDRDPRATAAAQRFLRRQPEAGSIQVKTGDGGSIDARPYDAVWVSLHVLPRERTLRHLLRSMRPGGRLVYRNPDPAKTLRFLYPLVSPERLTRSGEFTVMGAELGKQSVVITKTHREEDETMSADSIPRAVEGTSLENLVARHPATISFVPDDSQFAPLGIRPGKSVTVHCRHPLGGPVVIEIDGRRVALARELAGKVQVSGAGEAEDWLKRQIAAAEN